MHFWGQSSSCQSASYLSLCILSIRNLVSLALTFLKNKNNDVPCLPCLSISEAWRTMMPRWKRRNYLASDVEAGPASPVTSGAHLLLAIDAADDRPGPLRLGELPLDLGLFSNARTEITWWFFLKKWSEPALFFVYFQSFSNKQYFFATNQCEKRSKCPSSKQHRDSNPQPYVHESSPITTRPVLSR